MALDRHVLGEQFRKPKPDPSPPRPPRLFPTSGVIHPSARGTGTLRTTPPPDMVIGPDWRVMFQDNFMTSNLDTNKWWTRYAYHGGTLDYLNDEWQRYREGDGSHAQHDGVLHLTAQPYDAQAGYWPSAMLRSKDCYPIKDGNEWYFEARLKAPDFLGSWSAFWLAGSERVPGDDQSIPWPPEIDQMEIVNNGQDDTTYMLHCCGQVLNWDANPQKYAGLWAADGFNWDWMFYYTVDLSKDFHRYGLWYKWPEFVVYFDRKPILQCAYEWVADDGQPMPGAYLLCNLAVGGSWAGRYGIDNAALPQSLDLDYIRVWQRMPQSTIGVNLMPV